MKYLIVFFVAIALGYFSYSFFHETQVTLDKGMQKKIANLITNEARIYAEATNPEDKLVAARKMYNKMNEIVNSELEISAPDDRQVIVAPQTIESKKMASTNPVDKPKKKIKPVALEKMPKVKKTVAEKIHTNTLDVKTASSFVNFQDISPQDSRLKKMNGLFTGMLTKTETGRVDDAERMTLEVNQDTEKKMTKLEVMDSYDNVGLNIYQLTSYSFKSIPGDENLLLLRTPGGSVIFDLKTFPKLTGKVYTLNKLIGSFKLDKSGSPTKQ
jgi:hypothetical protein